MKLKEYLDTHGLKYKIFAKKLGMTQANFSNLVNDRLKASLKIALLIEILTNGAVSCEDLARIELKTSKKKQQASNKKVE